MPKDGAVGPFSLSGPHRTSDPVGDGTDLCGRGPKPVSGRHLAGKQAAIDDMLAPGDEGGVV